MLRNGVNGWGSNRSRARTLVLAAITFVMVFLLWQVSQQSPLLYPLRLFVTFVHESGHGLTAVLTGGRFDHFQVFDNGSGVASTAGGNRVLVLQMGYVGAALFGAVLLYAANRVQRVNVVAIVVGLYAIGTAVLFTSGGSTLLIGGVGGMVVLWLLGEKIKRYTTIFRWLAVLVLVVTLILVRSETGLIVGIVSGTLLILLGYFAPRSATQFILTALAFITGFDAIEDVWSLMSDRTASLGSTPNDALAAAIYTHTPVELWIVLWTGLAIVLMGASIYFALIKPIRTGDRLPQLPL